MTTPTKLCPLCLRIDAGCNAEECAAPAPEAKPTRVEVGQRWQYDDGPEDGPYTVVAKTTYGRFRLQWDVDDPGGVCDFDPDDILCDTFLGYAKPAADPGPVLACVICQRVVDANCPHAKPAAADAVPKLARRFAEEVAEALAPSPPRPIRREVSANGRD